MCHGAQHQDIITTSIIVYLSSLGYLGRLFLDESVCSDYKRFFHFRMQAAPAAREGKRAAAAPCMLAACRLMFIYDFNKVNGFR